MPRIAVAGSNGVGACGAAVDGEVEGNSAVATLSVESGELRVESRDGISTVVPNVLVAGGDGLDGRTAVAYGEVEGDQTVATSHIGGGEGGRSG